MLTKLEIYDPGTYPPCFDIGLLMVIWLICLLPVDKDCWAEELFDAVEKVLEKMHSSPQFVPNSCAIYNVLLTLWRTGFSHTQNEKVEKCSSVFPILLDASHLP